MFNKILIANRGEIACRVITTAKRLGIRTVAVFSDADVNSKHVAMADEAVRIGPPEVAASYLNGERIIDACKETGAEAVHPGYGFLSENPEFVEAVEAAGLVFIGPTATAIRAMGLKDAAKALMSEAGVPVLPGYHGDNQEAGFLADQAKTIGYPVMIKARAGGGGKGMRLVTDPSGFKSALEGAMREAQNSFGDPACLIEKYIERPRHIEIQVFGDQQGNIVHFFERDCSLQRRYQKVIEEAPAPGMTETIRKAMGRAAVDAAKAIGYHGAGTVEFIVDGSGPLREDGFWFMEMNTRLQVEHPVTEAITGLDLVELQFRVAAGDPLPFAQDDLAISGWSFEARVYAEDVEGGFLPATGTLDHLKFPTGSEFERGPIRIDSGVGQGDEISPWYDPMIAKVVVHGRDRGTALRMLTDTLAGSQVAGLSTNIEFLGNLSRHDGFTVGNVHTGLIEQDFDALTKRDTAPMHAIALAAVGGLGLLKKSASTDPWDVLAGWRHWSVAQQFITLESGDDRLDLRVSIPQDRRFFVETATDSVTIDIDPMQGTSCRVRANGLILDADIVVNGSRICVFSDGRSHEFFVADADGVAEGEQTGTGSIYAPMPGLVKVISVQSGARVSKGEALVVLEAMKMEHTLRSPRDGVIDEVVVMAGDQVADGALLLSLEPANE